jgi:uncharacterized peroxidase-related enzyme
MAWINEIDEDDAADELKEIYDDIIQKRGKLSNIMRVHSLNPQSMKYHMDLYIHLMFGSSPLSRADRELIAVQVSILNNCSYCIKHHAEALQRYWKNQRKFTALINNDFGSIEFEAREKILLEYVKKLTSSPSRILQDDVYILRDTGFSDRAILDIGLIVGYFNFVNRVVLGLGVEESPDEISGYKY